MAFRNTGGGTGLLTPGTPTGSIDIGDSIVVGASGHYSDSGHQHAFPAPGAGYTAGKLAAAAADGSATTPMRSDAILSHTAAMHGSGGHADLSSTFAALLHAPRHAPGGPDDVAVQLATTFAGLVHASRHAPGGPDDVAVQLATRFERRHWYDVKDYGAVGDGVHDDTSNINSAIAAANASTGIVFFPPGVYLVSGALTTLAQGVYLKGETSELGFMLGDSRTTSVIYSTGGAYDLVTQGAKGCGIEDLTLDTQQTAGGWAVRVTDATGFHFRNVAIRQVGVQAQNGVWLQGASAGVFQTLLENVSICTGGSWVGGTALKLGDHTSGNKTVIASTFLMVQIQGYATGIDMDNAAENTFLGSWVASCAVGVRFNGPSNYLAGGWIKGCTTEGVFFDTGAIGCLVQGIGTTGNTADVLDNGTRNWTHINGDWHVGFTGSWAEATSSTPSGVYPGMVGVAARLQLAKSTKTPVELSNDSGQLDFIAAGVGVMASMLPAGNLGLSGYLFLNRGLASETYIKAGTGVPSGGGSGDFYFRKDGGGAGATHLYFNNGGSWIGIA